MASKVEERIYLEWFFNQEKIIHGEVIDHEHPDFLVEIGGQVTGIEVTKIFLEENPGEKGSPIKAAESRRTKWLHTLAANYYKRHSTPIRLNLQTNSDLCAELSDALLSALEASSQMPLWKSVRVDIELPPGSWCVANVTRLPWEFSEYSLWRILNDHTCFVGDITRGHLLHALNKKSRRVADYLLWCEKVWLLLVADSGWNSGSFHIPNQLPMVGPTDFEKVWLLDYSETVQLLS